MRIIKQTLLSLLFVATSALATDYRVGIGVDCDFAGYCWWPNPIAIHAGDTITFYSYRDAGDDGSLHNVVADDGSFRCAAGCDGEGGNGNGAPAFDLRVIRAFDTPGQVAYHDEVTHAEGLIVVQGPVPGTISPAMTGSWYDPAQSGQGLFVEILPGNNFYAAWLSFDPSGTQQAWIAGMGTYSGNTASILLVEQPTGGAWVPAFDESKVIRNYWGSLNFTFTDCNHGRVDYSSITGYGSGSMNLTRLTQIAGLSCP